MRFWSSQPTSHCLVMSSYVAQVTIIPSYRYIPLFVSLMLKCGKMMTVSFEIVRFKFSVCSCAGLFQQEWKILPQYQVSGFLALLLQLINVFTTSNFFYSQSPEEADIHLPCQRCATEWTQKEWYNLAWKFCKHTARGLQTHCNVS